MSSDLNALYRRWLLELWNGDLAVAREVVTDGFVGHWPGRDVHGPDELAGAIEATHGMFSEVSVTLDVGPLVDGDLVAARWTFAGTYAGGIPGATARSGLRTTHHGADLLRAEGDRFAEYWVSADNLELMQQLGAT